MDDYTSKGYWLATYGPYAANPPLKGELSVDVAIIGGGFTGMAAAYFIKREQPALRVAVFEDQVVGYGASGRNGGFSMTLFGLTMGITAFRFGKEAAREAQHYMEQAVDLLDSLIHEHGIDCDYEYNGFFRVATTPAYVKRIQEEMQLSQSLGIEGVEWVDAERLRDWVQSPVYLGAWWEPRCAILNPLKLVRGMKRVAEAAGAEIHEHSPVTGFERDAEITLRTPSGLVRAQKAVFATNAYSAQFPLLASRQLPVHTHIVLTEPLDPRRLAEIGWSRRQGIEDARNFVHYYRLTADNRLLMGGERVQYYSGNGTRQDTHEPTFRLLENHVRTVFPVLQDVRFTHRWGGPVSVNLDFAPNLGYVDGDKRLVYSVGCIGHAVSMTHLNGWTIADLILERETERTDVFFVNRSHIPFPGEPLRAIAANGVIEYMRAEDAILERKGLGL
ncbi:MAG: NAD(P)/FAD-dependent oxidoreductase [Rudaea sp.]